MKKILAWPFGIFAIVLLGMIVYWVALALTISCCVSFIDIDGLDANYHMTYNSVIERKGEPHSRESITRNDERDLCVLHYDRVTFYILSDNGFVTYFDVIGYQYRLGSHGLRRIGVGSTRRSVEANYRWRSRTHFFLRERPCGIGRLYDPVSLPSAGFGFSHSGTRWFVEFEFDQNDIVTRMRIGNHS